MLIERYGLKPDFSWAEGLDRAVDAVTPEMIAVRRRMHMHPEPSGQEHKTTQFLYGRLAEEGFRVRMGLEGRGVIVEPQEMLDGPRIVLRGDMDALMLQDTKKVDYCSQVPGVMHGCGHDAHTSMVLGALIALSQTDLPVAVNWRGIFQPSEEINRGACEMVEAGALDDAAAIIALHVDPSRRAGTIGIREGPMTAACDEMEIRIEGRGGHAARPHESIDPISAAAQLISSIYLFVPRGVDSHDPVVVTIGQISGGHTFNVIPSEVLLRGTLRTFGGEVRSNTKKHIRRLARGLEEASGAKIHIQFMPGPESVFNDPHLTGICCQAAADLLGPVNVQEIKKPSMGGEDFANYLGEVPGCLFRLGCSGADNWPPLHSPKFDIDENALNLGAKILARAAVLWTLQTKPHRA